MKLLTLVIELIRRAWEPDPATIALAHKLDLWQDRAVDRSGRRKP
jgi:hypothetical protein